MSEYADASPIEITMDPVDLDLRIWLSGGT